MFLSQGEFFFFFISSKYHIQSLLHCQLLFIVFLYGRKKKWGKKGKGVATCVNEAEQTCQRKALVNSDRFNHSMGRILRAEMTIYFKRQTSLHGQFGIFWCGDLPGVSLICTAYCMGFDFSLFFLSSPSSLLLGEDAYHYSIRDFFCASLGDFFFPYGGKDFSVLA